MSTARPPVTALPRESELSPGTELSSLRSVPLLLGLLLAVGCGGIPRANIASRLDDDPPRRAGLPSSPDERTEPTRRDRGALSLVWENDVFAGKDQNYTNGFTLGYLTPPLGSLSDANVWNHVARLFRWLPEFGNAGEPREERIALALVHSMFTPAEIDDPNPPLDDQPYAGIASFDLSFVSRSEGVQHTSLVRLGWVGPRTGADELQKSIHEWIDSTEPLGWGTQLPDEGIVNIAYERRSRLGRVELGGNWSTDAFLALGASLGNYFTGANAGIGGRIGWNLADPLGSVSPQRGLTSDGFRCGEGDEPGGGWRFGVSAGVDGFAIGHYLPLDGTVFRESRSVRDRAPFVASGRVGFDLGVGRFGLGLSFRKFTETFAAERSDNEYGTLTFAWSF